MKLLSAILSFIFLFNLNILFSQPINDIVQSKIMKQKRILPYAPVQERDIMWKKYVWRIIDVREKMNLPFVYPNAPFFDIMTNAAQKGELALYSPEDEQFSYNLSDDELHQILFEQDTVEVIDENFVSQFVPVENNLNYENVKRFRIKEVWYFDSHYSVMKVRILGIAPLVEVLDENGDFKYERPLFWAAYNELRPVLAKEQVFNPRNDAAYTSWEDLMEMRYFASTIIKASNVHDRKIEEYLTGVDALLEAEKIKQEIFNFEHDLWSY